MRTFNEDTRVKIPATFQLLKIGYDYQSLDNADIDFNTKIFVNRFKPALEKINDKTLSDNDILLLLSEIHTLIRNNDYGRSFYNRLIDTTVEIRLIDFKNIGNNDFAVVDELPFTIEKDTEEGSFRPDINILINGMPLAFLEVKKPNNDGGIQAEFDRMINKRLVNPAYRKFFNLIQIVSFSNNMEYENEDSDDMEMVKAGSFYLTEDIVLYRATNRKWLSALMNKNVIVNKAFWSCSLLRKSAIFFKAKERYNCIIKIYAPKGCRALYVSNIESIDEDDWLKEYEVLLPRNSKFRVVKKWLFSRYIELELVEQEGE